MVDLQRSEDALDSSLSICRTVKVKNKSTSQKFKEKIAIYTSNVGFKLKIESKELEIATKEYEVLSKIDKIISFLHSKVIFTKSCLDDLPLRYKFAYRYLGSINNYDGNDILIFEKLDVYSRDVVSKLVKNKGLFERGVICYDDGQYQKALDYFQENIRSYPDDKAGYVYYNNAKDKVRSQ